jgi:hypothetical protein
MAENKRKTEMVAIRSTEKLKALKDKLADMIISANFLEGMVLSDTSGNTEIKFDEKAVGYHSGVIISTLKDILDMLGLEINMK